jgi:hypothetical protein
MHPERENAMSVTISTASSASTLVAEISVTKGQLYLTEVDCSNILLVRSLNWYLEKLTICAHVNSAAAVAIHDVVSLSASPRILLEPRLVGRVLAAALSRHAARNRAERLDVASKGAF